MKTPVILLVLGFLFISLLSVAQDKELVQKTTTAYRTNSPLKIDGDLNEADWQKAIIATGFRQRDPMPGDAASQKTEIRILYDNRAIYIGAMMYDTNPDSILQELTERDNFGNTDWFAFIVDAYQGGNDGVGFGISPAGIQLDTKYTSNGEDTNWDAVWNSKAVITPEGWVVEMEIPYSALRFPNQDVQTWNINFARSIRRYRETSFWNYIDPNEAGFLRQSGHLEGLKDIKPPLRLSATPFIAGYLQNYKDKTADPQNSLGRSFNGGMDIKYGINDAFTLDMTLIPDFGEAQSDNQVLNLSPFEVRFDENRQFFTEGIELFDKGGLFYSRRVGGTPFYYWDLEDGDLLEDGEEIVDNPQVTQLINATKVSGRTKTGLGVGVFNAVASKTLATVKNSEGLEREIETNPLTNYNVTVFDQNLKNNSSVTLINTNVLRRGDTYDANVTGVQFDLKNKDNSYGVFGGGALTQKYFTNETDLGHAYELGFGKISGAWNWEVFHNLESYDYDPNDLGFLRSPNEKEFGFNFNYNKYEPFWNGKMISGGFGGYVGYTRLHRPDAFNELGLNFWTWARTKNFTNFNVWTYINPLRSFDYFEPRREDFSRYFVHPKGINTGFWISTDYRKKLAIDFNGRIRLNERAFKERKAVSVGIAPRYRVNNKLSFRWRLNLGWINDVGYITDHDEDIIFGFRDRQEVTNTLNASYIFNNKMSLTFRCRHYWAKAEYNSFHTLTDDGGLGATDYNTFSDNSFNAFTIDTVYRWRFAPGSDIFVIWKNGIFGWNDVADDIIYDYGNSINQLGDTPQTNSLSVKIIYYLDYLNLMKRS